MNQNYFNSLSALMPGPLSRLQQELQNSLHDFKTTRQGVPGELAMNYWVKPGEVVMHLELPGITPEQIGLEMQGDRLRVQVTTVEAEAEQGNWIRKERQEIRLNREFEFSFPIDTEKSEASLRNGVLELKIVSREAASSVPLAIQF